MTPPQTLPETGPETLTVRYRRTLAWAILAGGAVSLGLGVWLLLVGSFFTALIVGAVLLVVGYLYLTRPYFEVKPDRVTVFNLLGKVVRRYPLPPDEAFGVAGNRLVLVGAGGERSLAVSRWLANPKDWQRLPQLASAAPKPS